MVKASASTKLGYKPYLISTIIDFACRLINSNFALSSGSLRQVLPGRSVRKENRI